MKININFQVILVLLSLFISFSKEIKGQSCSSLNLQFQSDIPSACNQMTITMIHDQLDRPFLYVANKEAGLRIYDITILTSPILVATIPISKLADLEVMNVTQDGKYLYLTLGNTFINPQSGGMAIIDVSKPINPFVTDYYIVPGPPKGGGIVKIEGSYAYLGAMASGLIILDINDKSAIKFLSQFVPDINFPPISHPDTLKINARGMEVKNSIVYLCYDAGGFRIIDCTNKFTPVEIGRYCNPALYIPFNLPRAYNNLVLDEPYVYVTVDYCGLEVLDISNPKNIKLKSWWNPYNCPDNNWFASPSHTNEIQFDKDCKLLFVASGKSDMMVLDISNPSQPDSCNFYGGVSNDIGTWGISLYKNQIYLSYICVPLPWPFPSNWTGVKILSYNPCLTTGVRDNKDFDFSVYPNPARNEIKIQLPNNSDSSELRIYNFLGQLEKTFSKTKETNFTINTNDFSNGLHSVFLKNGQRTKLQKFIVER